MRLLIAALMLVTGAAHAQTQNVQATGTITWKLPTTYTNGATIPAGALTKTQLWLKTAPIADTDTSAPTAEIAAPAMSYAYALTIPNGATLYVRVKTCAASVCGPYGVQMSKGITILIPGVPTGTAITVTVTLTQ